jgi:hypothetical protein
MGDHVEVSVVRYLSPVRLIATVGLKPGAIAAGAQTAAENWLGLVQSSLAAQSMKFRFYLTGASEAQRAMRRAAPMTHEFTRGVALRSFARSLPCCHLRLTLLP